MKYFKVLLPFLAISNGQEDGEEEDRQCVNCEEASVLIVGGEASNGNNYAADGIGIERLTIFILMFTIWGTSSKIPKRYEFLRNFFIEKYELGTFTPDWVQIQDDFVFPNEPNDEFCSNFYSQVAAYFENTNPSGYKTLVCQGKLLL